MRRDKRDKSNKGWCIAGLILCLLLLAVTSILLVFGFLGFGTGDFPYIAQYAVFASPESDGILSDGCAVVTDGSAELTRGCPVVFYDAELTGDIKINVLYLYSYDGQLFELSNEDATVIRTVSPRNIRGMAYMSLPYLGHVLEFLCSLYGICVMLVVVLALLVCSVLLIRSLARLVAADRANPSFLADEPALSFAEAAELSDSSAEPREALPGAPEVYTERERDGGLIAINDDLSYELAGELNPGGFAVRFCGSSLSIVKLLRVVTSAALKRNAKNVTTEEQLGDPSTLIVRFDREDSALIASIIKLLTDKDRAKDADGE